MYRTRIAAILAALLLFTMAAPENWGVVQRSNAEAESYLRLNFDNYPVTPSTSNPVSDAGGGGSWSFFNTVAGTDYGIGEVVPGKSGRSFAMVSNTTGRNINIQKSNLMIPGAGREPVIVMEGRFKFSTTTHQRNLFYANLTQLPGSTVLGYITVVADAQGKLRIQYPSQAGNENAVLDDYAPDEWYHIQIYVDMQNKQLQLYINGEQYVTNAATSTNWNNLQHFRFTQIGQTGQEGRMTIDDIAVYDFVPIADIELSQMTIRLHPNGERQLTAAAVPADSANPYVTWSSSNKAVADVDDQGNVTAYAEGIASITATSKENAAISASSVVEVVPPGTPLDEFDEMRERWKSVLDGGQALNTTNPIIATKVQAINQLAQSHWNDMIVAEPRTALWPDLLPSSSDSGYFTTYLSRLRDMTYAYSTQGGALYQDVSLLQDITGGLDWIYDHAYNEYMTEFGNWWNFDIGAPLRIMDMLVMLYDELSAEQINRYVRAADHFIGDIMAPSFSPSGANRSDILTIQTLMGILTKDPGRLQDVLVQMKPLFVYVAEGDGFYEDGSFIQHGNVAYTGSYGEVLIRGVGHLFYLLDDTEFEVTDPLAANVYRWIYEAISPVVYRGETMDMVRGRAIAREALSGHASTVGFIAGIVRLAMSAPEEDALQFKRMIKHWLTTTDPSLPVYDLLRIDLVEAIEDIMADAAIMPEGDLPAHYELAAMNRTVHYADDFAFGISKSSERIKTYELTNGENGEGWYTGDGMTYVYTKDATQFADDFWPTVNRYRLPGTTVDTRPRVNDHYQYGDGETTPNNKWAGGVTLGLDGVSGMNLQQVGTTLRANKSWFMFDDTIVALGSGITSEDSRTIETIVEQRKLNGSASNELLADGQAMPGTIGWNDELSGVSWMHLEGNAPDSDMGYYFPDEPNVLANRTANSGSWYDINRNDATSADIRTRNYVSFWFDHGANPVNETYSYVILPNRTPMETEQFAQAPTIQVVENSTTAHAVRDLGSNQLGINYWKDEVKTVSGVTSNRQASVLMKNNPDDTLEVAVSDPTFANTGAIELEIEQSAAAVLASDPEVLVTQLHPTIKLTVRTTDSLSRSFTVKFDVDPGKERPDAAPVTPLPVNSKEPAESAAPITHLYSWFDQEKLGNQPKDWTVENGLYTVATIESLPPGDDRFLRLIDRDPNGVASVAGEFVPQDGVLQASWKYIDLNGGSGTRFAFMDGDDVAAELISGEDGLYWVDGTAAPQLVQATAAANWYTVDVSLNAATGLWDIAVDGVPRVTGAVFQGAALQPDRIRITTGHSEADGIVYVDDIAIYVTGAVKLIADEFEANAIGVHPMGWTIGENAVNAPVAVVYEEEDRNKSVLMDDQNTSFRASIGQTFAPQSDRLVAEWRYKETGGGKYPDFRLLGDGITAIRLTSSSNNYFRYYGPGASANTTLDAARTLVNVWHTVKLDIHIASQTYDIYFDGALAASSLSFYAPVAEMDEILFASAYSAPDAPLYIDSVKVYTFTEVD